jgi:hypothetical protein
MGRGFLGAAVLFLILVVAQAWGQTWVTNTGFASNRLIWEQYNYPVASTPILSLNNVSIAPAGASNATAGNVAGATNATLSISNMGMASSANMVPPQVPLVSVSGQPTVVGAITPWRGPRPFVPLARMGGTVMAGHAMMMHGGPQEMMMAKNEHHREMLNTGASVFDNAYAIPAAPENLAEAAKQIRAQRMTQPPSKVFTNQDIERLRQQDANRPQTPIPPAKQ